MVDLEPFLATAVAGCEVAGAFVEPDHDGALCVRPLLPFGGYSGTGCDGGGEFGRGAAVAHYGFSGYGHGGVIVGPLALNGSGGGGGGEACVTVSFALVCRSSCLPQT